MTILQRLGLSSADEEKLVDNYHLELKGLAPKSTEFLFRQLHFEKFIDAAIKEGGQALPLVIRQWTTCFMCGVKIDGDSFVDYPQPWGTVRICSEICDRGYENFLLFKQRSGGLTQ